jgi:hypothetical protein
MGATKEQLEQENPDLPAAGLLASKGNARPSRSPPDSVALGIRDPGRIIRHFIAARARGKEGRDEARTSLHVDDQAREQVIPFPADPGPSRHLGLAFAQINKSRQAIAAIEHHLGKILPWIKSTAAPHTDPHG